MSKTVVLSWDGRFRSLFFVFEEFGMSWFQSLLSDPHSISHVILVYSLVIGTGVLLGRIRLGGVSLGGTCVLFAGLLAGHWGLTVSDANLYFLRDFGLTLFVFFIGLQVGPSFFSAFRKSASSLVLLTFLLVAVSIAVTLGLWMVMRPDVSLAQMMGVHFGAVTNTPGLAAAIEVLEQLGYRGEDITVAYACAYPLGVVATILTAIFLRHWFQIDLVEEERAWDAESGRRSGMPETVTVTVRNRALVGKTIDEVKLLAGRPFVPSRLLTGSEEVSPTGQEVLNAGDRLVIVCEPAVHEAVVMLFGGEEPMSAVTLPAGAHLETRRIRITHSSVNGYRMRDLPTLLGTGVNITHVSRAGMTLFPASELILQIGDVLLCVGKSQALDRAAKLLGNQERRLMQPNLVTVFIGIALGVLLGSVPMTVPGLGVSVQMGLAAGPLLVAILIGRYGSMVKMSAFTTRSANVMMRETGISLFLASVGLAAGPQFAEAMLYGNGLLYVSLGLVVTVLPLIAVGVLARRVFKMNFHSMMGFMAGATTDPPTLAYVVSLSERNTAAVAYSTVYPFAMLLRILTGQFVLLILWTAGG